MKIKTICDDFYHRGKAYENAITKAAPNDEHEFYYEADDKPVSILDDCDLLIIARSDIYKYGDTTQKSWMSDEFKYKLIYYVNNGGGLFIVHAGIACYGNDPELETIFSGYFDFHPPQCDVKIVPVGEHDFIKGIEPFEYPDEHYHLIMKDDEIDIFASAVSSHGEQPAGWFNTKDGKKICALIMGHTDEMLESAGYMELLKRCMLWFAK